MKTTVALTLALSAQAMGNILLSKEMKSLVASDLAGNIHWFSLFLQAAGSPTIWMATAFLTLFFLLFTAALSWADLSFVLPATSFGYVINVACGHYFLGEAVSPLRWVGTLFISIGVTVVARSGTQRADSGESGRKKERVLTEVSR